jgi:hypothetical protein
VTTIQVGANGYQSDRQNQEIRNMSPNSSPGISQGDFDFPPSEWDAQKHIEKIAAELDLEIKRGSRILESLEATLIQYNKPFLDTPRAYQSL